MLGSTSQALKAAELKPEEYDFNPDAELEADQRVVETAIRAAYATFYNGGVDAFTGESSISGTVVNPPVNYNLMHFGKGNVSDTINPASYRCVFDFGNFIFNAGVVKPPIADCNTETGIPTGDPTALLPQVTGAAANQVLATSNELAQRSNQLQREVEDFLAKLQAA